MQRSLLFAALAGSALAAAPTDVFAFQDDPAIQISLDKRDPLERGERVRAFVRTAEDGYLLVLHAEPSGRVRVLFPLDPFYDDYVRGNDRLEIRGRGDREAFRVLEEDGVGTLFALYSRDPFRFGAFVRADHWDYRALADWRLTADRDAEAELVALAQEITGQTFFEYDILQYGVGVSYTASGQSTFQYAAGLGWGSPYYGGGLGFGLTVGSGPFYLSYYSRPYRRWGALHFCDPFLYDAWACSLGFAGAGLWYDPYWYGGYGGLGYGSFWGRPFDPFHYGYYRRGNLNHAFGGVRNVNTAFGPTRLGLRKYAFKPDARSGLSGGVGMRQRAPETRRVASAGRRTTASSVRTVANRGRGNEGSSRVAEPRVIRPRGWGATDGRRVVQSSRDAAATRRRRAVDVTRPEVDRTRSQPQRRTGQDTAPTRRATPEARSDAAQARVPRTTPQRKPAEGPRRVTTPGRVNPRPAATPRRSTTRPSTQVRRPTRPTATRQPSRPTVRRPARPTATRQPSRPTVSRQRARPTVSRSRPAATRRPSTPTVRRSAPRPASRSRPRPRRPKA